MVYKAAKVIGIVTIPPLFVLMVVSWLWLRGSMTGFNLYWYLITLGLLAVVPALAYPLSWLIPRIKEQGRDGQRKLAFVLSILGYIAGVIVGQYWGAPLIIRGLFWGYLFSGGTLALINVIFHYKASGHACGLSGPIAFMAVVTGGRLWYLFLLLPLVFWARIRQDRHTIGNMLAGTAAGVVPTLFVLWYFLSNFTIK